MNVEQSSSFRVARLFQPAFRGACLSVLTIVAACHGGKNDDMNATASASATPSAAPPPASASAKAPPSPSASASPYDPMATMFGTMANEAKSRPAVHPSVDDAFAALARAGVGVKDPKQSLAGTYKAAYCSHGLIASKDLSVLLCEYPDEARASAGLAESKRLFVGLVTRETMANKTLLLVTIFQDEKHPASTTAAQRKVVATFKAL